MALENALIYGGFAAAAIGVVHNAINTNKPIDPTFDFDQQSVEIDPVERIRVCKSVRGKPLLEYRFDDVRTLYDVLPKGLALSKDGPCLGKRDGPGKGQYRWLKYSEVLDRVKWTGSGLVAKGIPSSNKTNIGIYSSNRSEWIIAEHACYSFSFPVVSLYDSYGKESIKYVIKHADLKAVFVDNFYRLCNVLENLDEYNLKLIVFFDPLNDLRRQKINAILETKANRETCEIISLDSLMEFGRNNTQPLCPPKPTDLATVCYTSGTTGVPKGAMISHMNFISNEAASHQRLSKPQFNYALTPSDVHYCFLPLAHLFGRISLIMSFLAGSSCGFISGDMTVFLDDLQELKPTNMPMVPRILNKFYNEVYKKVSSKPIQKMVLNHAISSKNSSIQKGKYTNTIYDRKIFNEIRSKFGGRFNKTISGSAPISNDVMKFSRAVLNCPIPEAYGQTEATCGITICHPFDPEIGHVGPPLECWMVKLIDVPDMNYFSRESKGEICVKGPSRFMGYLNDPEKTAEAIDKDGWLHTGDIGQWQSNGTLKIIDRKKNLFKLSQGEYISPEKLENVYAKSEYVSQVFVDGNPLKDSVVAVVVPDPEVLTKSFRVNFQDPIYHQSAEELCKLPKVKAFVLNDLIRVGKIAGLMSYEIVKNIHLHPDPFTMENDSLTPTLKLKRNVLHGRFKSIIDFLYKEAETTELGFARL